MHAVISCLTCKELLARVFADRDPGLLAAAEATLDHVPGLPGDHHVGHQDVHPEGLQDVHQGGDLHPEASPGVHQETIPPERDLSLDPSRVHHKGTTVHLPRSPDLVPVQGPVHDLQQNDGSRWSAR